MRLAHFVCGLALGVVIGWAARTALLPAPAVPPVPAPREESARGEPGPAPPSPLIPAAPPTPGPAPPLGAPGTEAAPASPAERLTHIRAMVASGSEEAFLIALALLARGEGEETERALLELMEDSAIPAPLRGDSFFAGLARSKLPGIGPAARRRFEANLAAGADSWTGVQGWAGLIAFHGDWADLEWLAARDESPQISIWTRSAIFTSPSEPARRMARQLYEQGKHTVFGQSPEYLRYDAEEGFRIAERTLRFLDPRDVRGSRVPEVHELLEAWATKAADAELADVAAFLLSLREPMHRVAAVYAVQVLADRHADTAPFAEILLEPALVLERREPEAGLGSARYAIEYNRVAWSERAAAALEAAKFSNEARKVRAGLASPWKEQR